jgi:hypothetical protein
MTVSKNAMGVSAVATPSMKSIDTTKSVVLEGDPHKAAQLRHDDDAMDTCTATCSRC